YGRGAGMMPTAVAVVSDVIEVARDILGQAASGLPLRLRIRDWKDRPIRDAGELQSRYYLRFTVVDQPGVLGQIDGVLGGEGIAIRDVAQAAEEAPAQHRREPLPEGERAGSTGRPVTVVMTTHAARERNMRRALEAFARLPS